MGRSVIANLGFQTVIPFYHLIHMLRYFWEKTYIFTFSILTELYNSLKRIIRSWVCKYIFVNGEDNVVPRDGVFTLNFKSSHTLQ